MSSGRVRSYTPPAWVCFAFGPNVHLVRPWRCRSQSTVRRAAEAVGVPTEARGALRVELDTCFPADDEEVGEGILVVVVAETGPG